MHLGYFWPLIGLALIACLPLPRLWGPKRECDTVPGATKDEAHMDLVSRGYQLPLNLDANSSAIHLKAAIPTLINISVYMHIVSSEPDAVPVVLPLHHSPRSQDLHVSRIVLCGSNCAC